MSNLEIHALNVGTLMGWPKASITYNRGWGEHYDIPMIMFVITGGDGLVLVDTGPADSELSTRFSGHEMRILPSQEPLTAMREAGFDPEDVSTIVNTHLHWDHCSNNHLFPNAEVIVQEAELKYAMTPLEPNLAAYRRQPGATPAWLPSLGRIRTVRGSVPIAPGISTVPLPGHSPGQQGVLVEAAERHYVLAGDAVDTYENWAGDEKLSHIPSSFTDLAATMDSLALLESLDADVVPSHDVAVLQRRIFR